MTSRSRLVLFSSVIAAGIAAVGSATAQQQSDPAPDQTETATPYQPAPAALQPDPLPRPPAKPRVKAASKPATPKTAIQAQAAAPPASSTPIAAPGPSAPPAQLPNGATSITESFGDWTVNCRIEGGQKYCVLSQAQGNKQTGQRTFAIELLTSRDGKTDGTILMPFGLKLDAGAVLKLDDKDLGRGLRFSTCLPDGCLLPVSFPAIATEAMKKGTTLAVAGLNLSSGQAVTFSISLNGFPAALKRVVDLGG